MESAKTTQVLTISEISCRNLRSADFLSKNDVYVVFKCGTKKVKTRYISGGGKNVTFKEMLTLNLSDADLAAGIDVSVYDYDVGSSDDLLGVGRLVDLRSLKQRPGSPRSFDSTLRYKGKERGSLSRRGRIP